MIEKELTKIVDLFHTKLDSFYSRTTFIDQLKVEPIDEHISMEVTLQETELCLDTFVAPTSIDIRERR